jgi:ribonuclease HI
MVVVATLFTDGSFHHGYAGAGWVLVAPDELSDDIRSGSNKVPGETSVQVELAALNNGLRQAQRLGVKRLEARVDCNALVRYLTTPPKHPDPLTSRLLRQTHRLVGRFEVFSIQWVERAHNREANRLAKKAAKRHHDREKETHGQD